jgi:hypothetical protein
VEGVKMAEAEIEKTAQLGGIIPVPETDVIAAPAVVEKVAEIKRFEVQQIIQHVVLMVSFTVLVITGLPMKFNTLAFSEWWVGVWGGVNVLRSVHHGAAYVMVALCIYHLAYIGYSIIIRRNRSSRRASRLYQSFMELAYFLVEIPLETAVSTGEKFTITYFGNAGDGGSGFIMMFPVATIFTGW